MFSTKWNIACVCFGVDFGNFGIVLQTLIAKITSSQETAKREQDARMETMMANVTSGTADITTSFEAKFGSMQQELATVNKDVMLIREEEARTAADLREIETGITNQVLTRSHHPAKLWTEQLPTFEAKAGENPVEYLSNLEEYSSLFPLSEVPEISIKLYCTILRNCTPNGSTQERGKPWRNTCLRCMTSPGILRRPSGGEEFAAIFMYKLPYKYQTHWSGRMDQDLASFREGLLEFDRIERLKGHSSIGTATEIMRLTIRHHYALTSHVRHTAHHCTDLIRDHEKTSSSGVTRNRIQFQGNTFGKEAKTIQAEEDNTTAGRIQDDEETTTGEDHRRTRMDRRRINSNRDIWQDRITIPEMTDRVPTEEIIENEGFSARTAGPYTCIKLSKKWLQITKKLLQLYEGPYEISRVINKNCYELKDPTTGEVNNKKGVGSSPRTSVMLVWWLRVQVNNKKGVGSSPRTSVMLVWWLRVQVNNKKGVGSSPRTSVMLVWWLRVQVNNKKGVGSSPRTSVMLVWWLRVQVNNKKGVGSSPRTSVMLVWWLRVQVNNKKGVGSSPRTSVMLVWWLRVQVNNKKGVGSSPRTSVMLVWWLRVQVNNKKGVGSSPRTSVMLVWWLRVQVNNKKGVGSSPRTSAMLVWWLRVQVNSKKGVGSSPRTSVMLVWWLRVQVNNKKGVGSSPRTSVMLVWRLRVQVNNKKGVGSSPRTSVMLVWWLRVQVNNKKGVGSSPRTSVMLVWWLRVQVNSKKGVGSSPRTSVMLVWWLRVQVNNKKGVGSSPRTSAMLVWWLRVQVNSKKGVGSSPRTSVMLVWWLRVQVNNKKGVGSSPRTSVMLVWRLRVQVNNKKGVGSSPLVFENFDVLEDRAAGSSLRKVSQTFPSWEVGTSTHLKRLIVALPSGVDRRTFKDIQRCRNPALERKGGGNATSAREKKKKKNPPTKWHRPARFPHVKIREPGIEPGSSRREATPDGQLTDATDYCESSIGRLDYSSIGHAALEYCVLLCVRPPPPPSTHERVFLTVFGRADCDCLASVGGQVSTPREVHAALRENCTPVQNLARSDNEALVARASVTLIAPTLLGQKKKKKKGKRCRHHRPSIPNPTAVVGGIRDYSPYIF
ncbi:hypothetical protein PR048_010565 [Dryococelus australis]|uniref:Uncharacterized protein n=1 Tax=Dryococelus australis TaxID=614101 RepID=A0ABQ9I338_9NEOP|nr:hypothetical protein PR048_010565 [Dryococelus australis]